MTKIFRVWDVEQKRYDTRDFLLDDEGNIFTEESFAYQDYLERLEKESYIVEFCTGMKDKNGIKIYEGDIIAQRIKNDEYLNIKEVRFGCFEDPVDYFNYDGVGFYAVGNDGEENGTLSYMAKFADYEVIGNIYEHKELLEEVE